MHRVFRGRPVPRKPVPSFQNFLEMGRIVEPCIRYYVWILAFFPGVSREGWWESSGLAGLLWKGNFVGGVWCGGSVLAVLDDVRVELGV